LSVPDTAVEGFISAQPFALTGAQRRVVSEIRKDLASNWPMSRLLEGEVGSGKTIVAAVALFATALRGYQGALMAPTEILAEQHGRTLAAAFDNAAQSIEALLGRPIRLAVLTGASRRAEREEIYGAAQAGELDVLVGTQALIQEGLGFRKLGLAIIDEQHRFGVMQRSALRGKGGTPHMLAMTATPIPRTLALTLYGDLDLSVIDELPPGRQKVKTYLLGPAERAHAYEHVRVAVGEGRQAFIICPLVEDSPHLEVRAATAEYERLKATDLAGLRLALLHGRMRPAEKDRVMLDFKNGEYDVLVSTSVVEVGIDVPNATVMLVEGADRFGMAQLHQFRGRVGRGAYASSCILLTDSTDEAALQRLQTVATVTDGFRLADEDLKLRGPGEYFGVRQSGFPDFRMADLSDLRLIETARTAASELLSRDPGIAAPEHAGVAALLARFQNSGNS
ncbi:MAG TPA: ATP-dependent DNA helicase RecG, partial [Chloroflexota bacterium]